MPHSAEMAALTLSQDFLELTERIKRDLNITILPWVDRSGSGEETIVRFCLNRSNADFLPTARDLVEEYLVKKEVRRRPFSARNCCSLTPRSVRSTSTLVLSGLVRTRSPMLFHSSTRSFSRTCLLVRSVISLPVTLVHSTLGGRADSEHGADTHADRGKVRMAASSPNIKALFDANPAGTGSSKPNRIQAQRSPVLPSTQQLPQFARQQHQHHQQQHHRPGLEADYPAFYPSPYVAHMLPPLPVSPYMPHQQVPLSPPPMHGHGEYHWPPSRHLVRLCTHTHSARTADWSSSFFFFSCGL